MTWNTAERQRAHDAADACMRIVFRDAYTMLSSSDARNIRADYLDALNTDHCTAHEYRRRIGGAQNLQSYAAAIRGNYENR